MKGQIRGFISEATKNGARQPVTLTAAAVEREQLKDLDKNRNLRHFPVKSLFLKRQLHNKFSPQETEDALFPIQSKENDSINRKYKVLMHK